MRAFLGGRDASIFAYGVTGSGKTHTMTGNDQDPGLYRRALETCFGWFRDGDGACNFDEDEHRGVGGGCFFAIEYAEIYRETVRDLLADALPPPLLSSSAASESPSTAASSSPSARSATWSSPRTPSLEIRQTADGRSFVQGLTSLSIDDGGNDEHRVGEDGGSRNHHHRHRSGSRSSSRNRMLAAALEVVRKGNRRRSTGAHRMNQASSRSHAILTIICRRPALAAAEEEEEGEEVVSRLNLVDLAGSERVSKTDAQGDRLKEAQAINKSLSSLGDVVSALVARSQAQRRRQRSGQQHSPSTSSHSPFHVPYRNSKLTFLLQQSLARPTSKVLVICNVDGAEQNIGETIATLEFAERCRAVERVKITDGRSSGSGDGRKIIHDLETKLRVTEAKLKQHQQRSLRLAAKSASNVSSSSSSFSATKQEKRRINGGGKENVNADIPSSMLPPAAGDVPMDVPLIE